VRDAPGNPKLFERKWDKEEHPVFVRDILAETAERIKQYAKDTEVEILPAFQPVLCLLEVGPLWMISGKMGIAILLKGGGEAQKAQVAIHAKDTGHVDEISWQVGDVLVLHENVAVEPRQGEIELVLIPIPIKRLETKAGKEGTEDERVLP